MSTPRPYQRSDFQPFVGTDPRTGKTYARSAQARQNLLTGDVLPRRQYQKAIGKPLPAHVAQPRQGKGPSKLYIRNVRRWSQEHALSFQGARSDPAFKSRWTHIRALWRAEQRGLVVDRSPGSDYALTLEELGMRAPGATYYVGDTP